MAEISTNGPNINEANMHDINELAELGRQLSSKDH